MSTSLKYFPSKDIYNKYMRRAKWKSRGVVDLDKAEEMYSGKTECEICNSKEKLYLDHSHDTGKSRGILCFNCNVGLGSFKDNPQLLKKAMEYIDNEPKVLYK